MRYINLRFTLLLLYFIRHAWFGVFASAA